MQNKQEKIFITVLANPYGKFETKYKVWPFYGNLQDWENAPSIAELVERMAKAMDNLNYLRAGCCTLEEMAEVALDAILPKREEQKF